jgi:hypothetical protein
MKLRLHAAINRVRFVFWRMSLSKYALIGYIWNFFLTKRQWIMAPALILIRQNTNRTRQIVACKRSLKRNVYLPVVIFTWPGQVLSYTSALQHPSPLPPPPLQPTSTYLYKRPTLSNSFLISHNIFFILSKVACEQTLLSTKRARERLWVGRRFLVLVTWIFYRFVERPLIGQCFIWIIYDRLRYFIG